MAGEIQIEPRGDRGGARPASSGDLQFISCSQYELVPSQNQLAKASLTRAMREPSGPDISATRGLMTPISQGAPLGRGPEPADSQWPADALFFKAETPRASWTMEH